VKPVVEALAAGVATVETPERQAHMALRARRLVKETWGGMGDQEEMVALVERPGARVMGATRRAAPFIARRRR
jgi:hypothetical protein